MPEPDWDLLLAPWSTETEVHSERLHTPWTIGHWHSWNEHAVEEEIAEFLTNFLYEVTAQKGVPTLALETGTGQGYLTRALTRTTAKVVCYESDVAWRRQLVERSIFPRKGAILSQYPTPGSVAMSKADVVFLDSMDPFRMAELCLWASVGKPGSYLWVHDTGNGHPSWDGHYTLGQLIRTLKLPGRFLENPRGSFVAQQDSVKLPHWVDDLWHLTLEAVGVAGYAPSGTEERHDIRCQY